MDNQPSNSNRNDKENLRCHGYRQKGHFRKDCLAEESNINHLREEEKEEEVEMNNNQIIPKPILKKTEEEDNQVNLRRDSNPYQYDIVNDFR